MFTPWKHRNSAATAKFYDSARNSAARGKLWALSMTDCLVIVVYCHNSSVLDYNVNILYTSISSAITQILYAEDYVIIVGYSEYLEVMYCL